MQYLIYVSASFKLLKNAEIKQILEVSRANNLRDDITGMLLYSEGAFMQVLEGDKDSIDTAFERITKDARHTGIVKLAQGEITERLFPDLAMGFKTATTKQFNQFSDFVAPTHLLYQADSTHPAVNFLKSFIESHKILTVIPVITYCLPKLFD